MDIQRKITDFVVVDASWIIWLLIGFSMGGLAVVLQRALYLIGTTRWLHALKLVVTRSGLANGFFPWRVGCRLRG